MIPQVAVDSSAIVAIINREAEAGSFLAALADVPVICGWPTVVEVRLWLARRPGHTTHWLDDFLANPATEMVPFGQEHEQVAARASAIYGRGRHAAGLNFGDCMAYAVAMRAGVPLLFKGGDFGKTDVAIHPASVLA